MVKSLSAFLGLILVGSVIGISITNAQQQPNGYAKIRFIDNKEEHSKTYIGKLTKGKVENLKYELNNNFAEAPSKFNNKNNSEPDGSDAVKSKKNWKKNRQKATNDLLGNYEIKDEKSLKRVREKKLKESEKQSGKSFKAKNPKDIEEKSSNRPGKNLSEKFRIRGKRIRNGQTFTKHAGTVRLIVKYKIREGNYINTYVDIVEDYLKEDSKYNLRYHGSGSHRKYYLEYAPLTTK